MLPADDPGKAPFWEVRLAVGDIPGISAISQIGTFLKDGPIHDNPAFAARTPPGEVIDSARWRVPSASNFGEPPGQSQSTTGFVSVDRSQRGQGTGDSSLIGGRRRAAIGAERLRTDVQRAKPRVSQFDSQSLGGDRGFHWSQQPSRSTMRADVSGRPTPLLVSRGAAIRAILDQTASR